MTQRVMEKLREPLSDLALCGLPPALEAMGERWSFMILRAAFNKVRHFEEFLESLGIARNILSNRLSRLVEAGILKREHCADDRRRIEYRLTPKGYDLLPAMLALRQWGEMWKRQRRSNLPRTPAKRCTEKTRVASWPELAIPATPHRAGRKGPEPDHFRLHRRNCVRKLLGKERPRRAGWQIVQVTPRCLRIIWPMGFPDATASRRADSSPTQRQSSVTMR